MVYYTEVFAMHPYITPTFSHCTKKEVFQISFLQICPHLLKKSLIQNFIYLVWLHSRYFTKNEYSKFYMIETENYSIFLVDLFYWRILPYMMSHIYGQLLLLFPLGRREEIHNFWNYKAWLKRNFKDHPNHQESWKEIHAVSIWTLQWRQKYHACLLQW